MRMMNSESRAVLIYLALDWLQDDASALQAQWSDVGNGSAAEMLARQLKQDLRQQYVFRGGDEETRLMSALLESGLKRVDFRAVAERLLWRTEPAEQPEEDEQETA
jgi:hypothetical protein